MSSRESYNPANDKWNPGQAITENKMNEIENRLKQLTNWAQADDDNISSARSRLDMNTAIQIPDTTTVVPALNETYRIAKSAYDNISGNSEGASDGKKSWVVLQAAGVSVVANGNNYTVSNSLENAISAMNDVKNTKKQAEDNKKDIATINGKWEDLFDETNGTYALMYNDFVNAYHTTGRVEIGGGNVDYATSLTQKINDMDAKISGKVNTANIVDNLSNSSGSTVPLSAKQGYVLDQNKIDKSSISTTYENNNNKVAGSGTVYQLSQDKLDKSAIENHEFGTNDFNADGDHVLSSRLGNTLYTSKLDKTAVVDVLTSNDTTKVLRADVGPKITNAIGNAASAAEAAANSATDTKLMNYVHKDYIANNYTTDDSSEGYVLDARKGKELKSLIKTAQDEIDDAHYINGGQTLDARLDNIDGGSRPDRTLPNVIEEIDNAHRTTNDTLDNRFDAIDNEISHAANTGNNDPGGIKERVSATESTLTTHGTSIGNIQGELNDAHRTNVVNDNLANRFGDLDTSIASINTNINTIAGELGMLNQSDITSNTRIDTIQKEINDAHRQNVTDDQGNPIQDTLDVRFDQIEDQLEVLSAFDPSSIQAMQDQIDENTEGISNLGVALNNTNADIHTIAEELNMLDNQDELTSTHTRIDVIENEIDNAHRLHSGRFITENEQQVEIDDNLGFRFNDIENSISHAVDVQNNDPGGLTERLTVVEEDINTTSTGLKARLTEAEQRLDAIDDPSTGALKDITDDIDNIETVISHAADLSNNDAGGLTERLTTAELTLSTISNNYVTQTQLNTAVGNNSTTIIVASNEMNFDTDGKTPTTLKSGTINDNDDYLIQDPTDNKYYYWKHITVNDIGAWHLMGGAGGGGSSSGEFATSLQAIQAPNENTDYFVGNTTDGYVHYRYVASTNEFIVIGSVLNTEGIKRYNVAKSTEGDSTYLDLYEFNYGEQKASNDIDKDGDINYRIAHIELPKGGGGTGATDTVCSVMTRTDQDQVLSYAETSTVRLQFLYYAFERQDDGNYILHPGTYTLRKGNLIIDSGRINSAQVIKQVEGVPTEMTAVEKAALSPNLSFDVTKYCSPNVVTNFELSITGAGITRTRPCSVELVDLKISSTFNDQIIHDAGSILRIPLVISGTKVDKTIYVTIDEGTEDEYSFTQPHGENAAATTTITIPAAQLTNGVHSIKINFSQLIGQSVVPSFSNTLHYDIACRDVDNDNQVLLSSSARGQVLEMEQYSTLKIPYYLYVPQGMKVSIVKTNSLNGKSIVEDGVTGEGTYLFKAVSVENNSVTRYTVTIGCRSEATDPLDPSITFQIDVTPNQYSIEPVLDHLVFDFNPAGYINNPENEEDRFWVDDTNTNIKLSIPTNTNFDWDNGGWKYDEENDSPYFCVKAGSRAQINYSLFQQGMEGNTTQGGSEFKCIFKAMNVRDPEAVFLTSLDNTPSTVIEYSTNKTSGDQSAEEGDEDTLFSSYFNVKVGHVYTWKKGKIDADKIAVTVIDKNSLSQGEDISYIMSDEDFNSALSKAMTKVRKKNLDAYAEAVVADIEGIEGDENTPGYQGADRNDLLAYVTTEALLTDKATAESIWNSLQNDATWAGFRANSNVYAAVEIDITQLIKNYALSYTTDIEYTNNFDTMQVINDHDDIYANKEIKRVIAKKLDGNNEVTEEVITEIEIDYSKENNVKTYKDITIVRQILSEISRPRGLEMRAHRSNIYLNNGTLTYPYSEGDIIEFEYNVNHPLANKYNAPIVMYEDGVPSAAMLYPTNNNALEQTNRGNLIIGSDDCDIWIYRMKFYNKQLDNKEILSNFYADALNPEHMVDRYVRNTNCYTDAANPDSITPQSVAAACPDLRIIMIEAPYLTGGKNSFIKNTKIRCIYKGTEENPARPEDNWVALNAYHAGQGTSSDAYGAAGRNLDIIFGFDGVDQLIAPKAKNNYRFDSNYKSILITGVEDTDNSIGDFDDYIDQILASKNEGKQQSDSGYITKQQLLANNDFSYGDMHVYQNGSGKVNFTDESVPNNWFNIKLNIASSENANNALLQKRFDRYLPYETPAMKKDSRVKNDMEFFNCVVFLREVGSPSEFKSDASVPVNNRQWHFYGIGNIGDSKKTDNTRINIPGDPNEFCVEVSDNGLTLSGFSSGVYYTDETETTTTYNPVGAYSIKYPVTTEEWENENNTIYPTLYDFEEDGGWDSSVEFRYDISTKDGNTIADSAAEKALAAERQAYNKEMYAKMYEWVVTAPKSGSDSFTNHLRDWFIEDSPLYWYLFTERYTMIDSRAKNTFYHFGKVFITQDEADGVGIGTEEDEASNEEGSSLYAKLKYAQANGDGADVARAQTALDTAIYIHENADCFVIEGEERTGSITYPNAAHINNGYRFEMWDYDNDTALGINNNGQMVFDAGLEDVDRTENAWVYNEATNVFWKRIRNETTTKLRTVYSSKKADCFNAENLITEFDRWQEQFAENLWRMDFERKYYRPYLEANEITYLQSMANGRKKYQRREFERNMCVYIDSKYITGDAYDPNDFIQFRPTNQQHTYQNKYIAIKLYSPMYINFTIGNQSNVSGNHKRGKAGETHYFDMMEGITDLQNIQTKIFNASCIMEISGLENYYTDDLRFSTAKKLRKLALGTDYVRDSNGDIITSNYTVENGVVTQNSGTPIVYYNNNTTTVSLGEGNPILEELDVRNCIALAAELNLAGCISLQKLYATGTSISRVTFATNGLLQRADLPSTITHIKLDNLALLTTLNLTGYSNIISYESHNTFKYNSKDLVENILGKVTTLKLNDINWNMDNITDLEKFKDKQDILGTDNMNLEGSIFITGEWSEVEQEGYREVWPNLIVTGIDDPSHKKIKQLLIYHYEIDGVAKEYRKYENENADIIDIAYNHTIPTPTRPHTAQYEYTFGSYTTGGDFIELSGWSYDPEGTDNRKTLAERWDSDGYRPRVRQNNENVYAVFNGEDRRYPIKWYLERDNTKLIRTSSAQAYGGGVTLDAPTVQDIHNAGWATKEIEFNTNTNPKEVKLCRIFKGWEKLPININPNANDTSYNIYAEWEELRNKGLPSVFTDTTISTEMKLAVLSSMTDAERAQYLSIGQQFSLTSGYTGPNDDSLYGGQLLIGPGTQHLMFNSSYPAGRTYEIARFDSTTTLRPFRSSIQPLRAGNDAFTLAIDYSFDAGQVESQRSNIESVLISCYEAGSDSEHTAGFKLYYNTVDGRNGPRISWGDTTLSGGVTNYSKAVGNSASAIKRNTVVLRHIKNSPILYIYSGINSSGKMITDINDATLIQQLTWQNFNTNAYLVFGNLTLDSNSTTVIPGKGIINWVKYWNEDLGVGECRKLAAWNHEQMTYAVEEYAGMPVQNGSRFVYMDGNVPNIVLTSVNSSSYGYAQYEADSGQTEGSTIGWPNSPLQSVANKRIFYSLPTALQSIISKSPIRSRVAKMSNSSGYMPQYEIGNTSAISTQDYIFFPSAVEFGETNELYLTHEAQGRMKWLNAGKLTVYAYDSGTTTWTLQTEDVDSSYMNLRFPNLPIKTTEINRVFISYSEQTSIYDSIVNQFTTVNPGDIVINDATGAAYMYVNSTQQSNGMITVSATRTSLFGCPSGGWVKADTYWTRSPFDLNTNTGTLMYINAQGMLINQTTSSDTRGYGLNYSFAI